MAYTVSLVGIFATVIGLLGLISPQRLADIVGHWQGPTRFWAAITARLAFGAFFLVAAPMCRLPIVVRVVGAITIIAALTILIIGQSRLDIFIAWWLRQPKLVRISALFAFGFGLLLIYAGA
ncbi:MAG: hypothetical protein CMJ64_21830 [Planctomycetaceae bacterium]|nr:hypothetical protein [Planctomycetaceae bacterium]